MTLTDVVLRRLKPGPKTVRMADEKGLYLEVSPSWGTWWRLKYRFDGKEKRLALGVYPEVSLKEARERRDGARGMLWDGIDPGANRKARKTAEAKAGTGSFEVVAREWHDKFSPSWDSRKYRDITLRRLELNVFPWLGRRPIAENTAPGLLTVIQRIEARGAIDTAHRILGLCGQIFRFTIAASRAERDISQDLHDALAPRQVEHFAATTEPRRLAEILRALDGYRGSPQVQFSMRLAPWSSSVRANCATPSGPISTWRPGSGATS